jgi:hypothetical protein
MYRDGDFVTTGGGEEGGGRRMIQHICKMSIHAKVNAGEGLCKFFHIKHAHPAK